MKFKPYDIVMLEPDYAARILKNYHKYNVYDYDDIIKGKFIILQEGGIKYYIVKSCVSLGQFEYKEWQLIFYSKIKLNKKLFIL